MLQAVAAPAAPNEDVVSTRLIIECLTTIVLGALTAFATIKAAAARRKEPSNETHVVAADTSTAAVVIAIERLEHDFRTHADYERERSDRIERDLDAIRERLERVALDLARSERERDDGAGGPSHP
jgi:hypothetical protein